MLLASLPCGRVSGRFCLLLLLPQLIAQVGPDCLPEGGEGVGVGLGPLLQQAPREILQVQLLAPSLLLRPQLPEGARPYRPQEIGWWLPGRRR